MLPDGRGLPDGFVVRLRDEVEPAGTALVARGRVMRLAPAAQNLLVGRTVTVVSRTSAALAGRLLDLDLADPVIDRQPDLPMTVVVPVRDNPAGVDRLLRALAPHLPCVVVDDASVDPQAVARVTAARGARLVRLDHNVGPAAARDAGLRQVDTSLVAFVDSDVQVSAGALDELARHFADPVLAAVAPRVRTRAEGRWFERYEAACGSLDLGPRAATVRPWTRLGYVPSACVVARIEAIGSGFDPTLRSGEDVDLIWRLQAAGHRVRYAAEVHAWHDSRATLGGWLGRKAFYGTSAAPLAARHGDRVAPAVMTVPLAATVAGLLVQRRWSFAVAAVGAAGFARDARVGSEMLSARQRASVVAAAGASAVQQTSGLMLRHWWPVSLPLAVLSRRYRRVLAVTAVIDGLAAHRSAAPSLDPVRFTAARRLDDLAYGAGVWWGAARHRSARCLVPRWIKPRPSR